MRIAIVDDSVPDRESLRRRLNIQLSRLAMHAGIYEFTCGMEFLFAAEKERFDLVFLDIYLENENGVDTARKLRSFDKDCLLVFTTASTDYALDGFRVRATHYLVKPYSMEELADLLDEVVKRLPAQDKYIEVSAVGGAVRLRFSEILYAEHYRHQIHIHTADGQKTVIRQTFREFTENLSDERFFLCGRGMMINLEYAEDFDGADFILKNGERLPVSRDLAKTARLTFGDFLFKRGPKL